MKKKVLVSSLLTIALCLSLIAGSTYALFTSQTKVDVAVTSGKVDVTAAIDSTLKTWSLGETEANNRGGSFANGGTATIDSQGQLVISRMTPGDVVKFTIQVTNNSNVAVKYRVKATSTIGGGTVDLSNALTCVATINGEDKVMNQSSKNFETDWVLVQAPGGNGGDITDITVVVTFPNGTAEHDNPFRDAQAKMTFTVEAVQGNGV